MNTILCVGDSLTYGARDEYHSSYPAELSRLYWERDRRQVHCVNHGINGETSGELLRRIHSNTRSCPDARIALLLVGTNDTFLPQDPGIYRDNLRQVVQVLEFHGKTVFLGTLPPILGPGLPNYPREAAATAACFNRIIRETAEEHDCYLVDHSSLGPYVIDTVHLNHAGYAEMADLWYQAIEAVEAPVYAHGSFIETAGTGKEMRCS